MPKKRVRVMRHGPFVRAVHWAIVLEAVFLLLSGFQLNGVFPIGLPENLYSYHIIVGFAFIGTAFVLLYAELAASDYRWFSLRRIPYSIRYLLFEGAVWFRLRPGADEPIEYDLKKRDYTEKLIPTEIVVWWGYAIFGIILALTGLADAFPGTFGFVYSITNPLGLALTGVGGIPFLLAVHRLAASLLVAVVVLHFYSSVIYRMVSSMFTGYRDEPTVGEGGDGAPGGVPHVGSARGIRQPPGIAGVEEEGTTA
jgi:methanophenazine hydrogenase, cytochrome b subunit